MARDQSEASSEPLSKIISRMARHGVFALRGPIVYSDGFKPYVRSEPLERIVTTNFVKRLEDEADTEYYLSVFDQDEG